MFFFQCAEYSVEIDNEGLKPIARQINILFILLVIVLFIWLCILAWTIFEDATNPNRDNLSTEPEMSPKAFFRVNTAMLFISIFISGYLLVYLQMFKGNRILKVKEKNYFNTLIANAKKTKVNKHQVFLENISVLIKQEISIEIFNGSYYFIKISDLNNSNIFRNENNKYFHLHSSLMIEKNQNDYSIYYKDQIIHIRNKEIDHIIFNNYKITADDIKLVVSSI